MASKKEIRTIVVIGSGNVATHLSLAFYNAGLKILQIYSRNLDHAKLLANKLNASYTSDLSGLAENADLYLFAISDSAIQSVLDKKDWKGKLLVHTAGSISISIFKAFSENFGVIYPLQTFSKIRIIDISSIPFFIEANSSVTLDHLKKLVCKISKNASAISFEDRLILHLAAVFANNFSNHMFTIAADILEKHKLPIKYLHPLIQETSMKAIEVGPVSAQTGPAVRNNIEIIQKHITLLENEPELQNLYKFISENIIKYHKQ